MDNLPSVKNYGVHHVFPQQRELMGSSAQNSSGVHWCRRRVRFNEVPEKVPKVPEQVWEALVQSQVRFNRVPEKVPVRRFGAEASQVQEGRGRFRRRSGRLWCRARSSSTVSAKSRTGVQDNAPPFVHTLRSGLLLHRRGLPLYFSDSLSPPLLEGHR